MLFFSKTPKKILVIDDDASMRRLLNARLKRNSDWQVLQAATGRSGLDAADTHRPDVIILDWLLPDIDGPDVLKQLKQQAHTRQTPVMMLTGRSTIGDIEDALALGASDYVIKPLEMRTINGKVAKLLA